MKKLFVLLSLTALLSAVGMQAQVASYDVVPLPRTVSLQQAPGFVMSNQTLVFYTAQNADMARNAQFLSQYVEEMTHLQLSARPLAKAKEARGHILLELSPRVQGDEAYQISVSARGVVISGRTPAGVFRGIQTLRKSLPLVPATGSAAPVEAAVQVSLPAVVIQDEPRFAYRGMHLDCSRHFFSIDFVKEYIDLIALHGMNKFHWHLTDDQGWRFESKAYPRLNTVGAWRSGTTVGRNSVLDDGQPYGGYYTQQECRDIVQYAADRYITVIPEIDMPGHMVAALAAYPELGCTGGPYEVEHHWGIFPDVLCAGKEASYRFVEDILTEVIDVFPSEYIHIGGDECPRSRWEVCPQCQQRIAAEGITSAGKQSKEDRLQGYFTRRVERFLHSKGKKLIGWDELMGCGIDTTATIMSWTGAEPGAKGAKLGHDVIMTPNSPMYFDHYQTKDTWGEPLAIGGFAPSEKVYEFEPVAADLTPQEARHILGVQANVWCEYIVSPQWVEYMVLPRMAALSEVQWLQPEQKDFASFRERMNRLKAIYDLHHWTVAPHLFQ